MAAFPRQNRVHGVGQLHRFAKFMECHDRRDWGLPGDLRALRVTCPGRLPACGGPEGHGQLCDLSRPMELRQLAISSASSNFGSMGRAAVDLDMVQSALSQQISRLESELSTRLLQRTAKGAVPTEAGLAFFREAQLACAMPTRPRGRRRRRGSRAA